jgi:hypothetical protein
VFFAALRQVIAGLEGFVVVGGQLLQETLFLLGGQRNDRRRLRLWHWCSI